MGGGGCLPATTSARNVRSQVQVARTLSGFPTTLCFTDKWHRSPETSHGLAKVAEQQQWSQRPPWPHAGLGLSF